MDETMRWDGIWTHRPSHRPVCRLCFRTHTSGPSARSRSGISLNYTTPKRSQADNAELSCDSWSACSTSSPSDRDVSKKMLKNTQVQATNNEICKRKRYRLTSHDWMERESSTSCSTSRNSARHTQINSFSRHTYFHRNCYTAPSPRNSLGSISPSSRSTSHSKPSRDRDDKGTNRKGTHRARKDIFERRLQVNNVDVQTNPPSTRSFGTSPIVIQESLMSIPRVSSPSNASSLTAVLEEPEERRSSDYSPFVLRSTRLHPPMELTHRKTKEEEEANNRIMNTLKQIYLHDKHCTLRSNRQSFNSGQIPATRTPPAKKSRKVISHRAQAYRKYSIKISNPGISEINPELTNERKDYIESDKHYLGNDEIQDQSLPQCWSESNSSLERNKDNLNVHDSYSHDLSPYLSTNVAKTYSLGTQSSLSSVWERPDEHFECVKTTNVTSEINSKFIKEINSSSLYNRDRISACGTQNVFLSTSKEWELNKSVSPIPGSPEGSRGSHKVNQSKNSTRKISSANKRPSDNSRKGSGLARGKKPQNGHRTTSKSGSSTDRFDAEKKPKQQKKKPRRKPPNAVRRKPNSRAAPGNFHSRSMSSGGSRSSGRLPSRSVSRRTLQGSKSTRSPQRTTSSATKRTTLQRGSGRSNTSGSPRGLRSTSKPETPIRGAEPCIFALRGDCNTAICAGCEASAGGGGMSDGSIGSQGRNRQFADRGGYGGHYGAGGRVNKKTCPRGPKPNPQKGRLGTKGGTKALYLGHAPRHKRPQSYNFRESSHKVKKRRADPDELRERDGKDQIHGDTERDHDETRIAHNTGQTHDTGIGYDMKFGPDKDKENENKSKDTDDVAHHMEHDARKEHLEEKKSHFGGRRGGGPCGSKGGPCSADNDISLLRCVGMVDASTQCHCTDGTKELSCIIDCPGQSDCTYPLTYISAGTQVEEPLFGLTQEEGTSYGNAAFGGAQFPGPPTVGFSYGSVQTGGTQPATSPFEGSQVPFLTNRIVPRMQNCPASQRQYIGFPAGGGPSAMPSGTIPFGIGACKMLESRGVGSSLALPPSVGVGSGSERNLGGGGSGGMVRKGNGPCEGMVRQRPPCEQKRHSNEYLPREAQRESPTVLQCGPPCNTGVGGSGGFIAPMEASGAMVVPIEGSSGGMAPMQGTVGMNAPMTGGSLQPYNHPVMGGGLPGFRGPQTCAGRPGGNAVCGVDKSVQCGQMRRNVNCGMMMRSDGGMRAELLDRPRLWSVPTKCGGMNTQHENNTFAHVNMGGVQCCKAMDRCQPMYFDSIPGGCGIGVNVPPQDQDGTPDGWPGGIGPNDPAPWDTVTQVRHRH